MPLYLVIRLRGTVDVHPDVEKTLYLLRLRQRYAASLYHSSLPGIQDMLRKVQDWATWGEIERGPADPAPKNQGQANRRQAPNRRVGLAKPRTIRWHPRARRQAAGRRDPLPQAGGEGGQALLQAPPAKGRIQEDYKEALHQRWRTRLQGIQYKPASNTHALSQVEVKGDGC